MRGYLREPKVSVEVDAYRPFFVLGEVTNSGQFPYVNGMTVQTAVAIAGGFTPARPALLGRGDAAGRGPARDRDRADHLSGPARRHDRHQGTLVLIEPGGLS